MPDGEVSAGKHRVPDHRTTGSSSGYRRVSSSLYSSSKNISIDIGVTKEEVSWDTSGRILNWKKVLKMVQKRVCYVLWMVFGSSWVFV